MEAFHLRLESTQGPLDGVHVRRLEGREAISELYRFDIDLLCAADPGLPDTVGLGAELAVVFEEHGEEVRRIHGIVASVDATLETTGTTHAYRLVLVPRLHQMTLVQSPSIYVGANVEKVIAAELGPYQFEPPTAGRAHDYEVQLLAPTPNRELTVQYGESDFAFVSRLAEHHGISFFFEQLHDRDRLVFTDHNGRFRHCPGAETVAFNGSGTASGLFALALSKRLVPAYYHLTDYNYRTPQTAVHGEHVLEGEGVAGGMVEQDAHPATPDEATTLARIRAEEQHCRQVRYLGKSTVSRFAAGTRVKVTDHPRLAPSGELEVLLVEVRHEAVVPTPWEESTVSSYRNELVAVPADRPFRPERKTPRPKMPGVVTGVIQPTHATDPTALALLDDQGRYRVQLHFDLESPDRPATSSWLRMAQPFEGGTQGMHFPLRPGTEVLVAFANGDPDRPVIVGALPNATAPSPVTAQDAHLHRVRSPNGMVIEFGPTVASTPRGS